MDDLFPLALIFSLTRKNIKSINLYHRVVISNELLSVFWIYITILSKESTKSEVQEHHITNGPSNFLIYCYLNDVVPGTGLRSFTACRLYF